MLTKHSVYHTGSIERVCSIKLGRDKYAYRPSAFNVKEIESSRCNKDVLMPTLSPRFIVKLQSESAEIADSAD